MIKLAKKMGRPTDNPKPDKITVRFDEECMRNIEAYCKNHNVSKVEAIRVAVRALKTK